MTEEGDFDETIINIIGCPAIKHDHRKASQREIDIIEKINPEILNSHTNCLVCNPYDRHIILKKPLYCPYYTKKIKIEISPELFNILEFGFNKFLIPVELKLIIYDYYQNQITHTIKEINIETTKHMAKCKLCAEILLDYVTLNTCITHIIPRNYCNLYNNTINNMYNFYYN